MKDFSYNVFLEINRQGAPPSFRQQLRLRRSQISSAFPFLDRVRKALVIAANSETAARCLELFPLGFRAAVDRMSKHFGQLSLLHQRFPRADWASHIDALR